MRLSNINQILVITVACAFISVALRSEECPNDYDGLALAKMAGAEGSKVVGNDGREWLVIENPAIKYEIARPALITVAHFRRNLSKFPKCYYNLNALIGDIAEGGKSIGNFVIEKVGEKKEKK